MQSAPQHLAADHPAIARVEAFMVEYDAQWRKAAPFFDRENRDTSRDGFEVWRELMAETTARHCTSTANIGLAGSFGSPPDYGPQSERLLSSEAETAADGTETAYVLTKSDRSPNMHHEYVLRSEAGEWRIHAIAQHFGSPTAPFVDRATVESQLAGCARDARGYDMPPREAGLDEVRNFTVRDVPHEGGAEWTTVEPIGTLVTSSGALAVLDFMYGNDDARPLARTVEPGAYPVDRVVWRDRNAAIRVTFSDAAPVEWIPATTVEGGHVFGVDAGCACVVDYPAYASMTPRRKSAAEQAFESAQRPCALEFAVDADNAGLAFDSGFGDGGYPVYWGLDAAGRTAQLVIDFMVLLDEDADGNFTHK